MVPILMSDAKALRALGATPMPKPSNSVSHSSLHVHAADRGAGIWKSAKRGRIRNASKVLVRNNQGNSPDSFVFTPKEATNTRVASEAPWMQSNFNAPLSIFYGLLTVLPLGLPRPLAHVQVGTSPHPEVELLAQNRTPSLARFHKVAQAISPVRGLSSRSRSRSSARTPCVLGTQR